MAAITTVSKLIVGVLVLLSTTVSSSFVPKPILPGAAKLANMDSTSPYLLGLKGGSEENVPGEADAITPPAQSQVPESIPAEISPPAVPAVAQTSLLGPNAPPPGILRRNFPNFPWHRLPDWLTYMRCIAIPALIVLFYQPNCNLAVGTIFAFASITDYLDGFLARRWDISSAFGAFLDPVADKLMVSTSLVLLAGRYGAQVAIPTTIILARELAVSALREWMAQRGQRDVVKVGYQGKVKTALTMVALTVLLFVPTSGTGFLASLYTPGLVMLYLCSVVTVTSGSVYFMAAAPLLMEKS